MTRAVRNKVKALREGVRIVTNDVEMDEIEAALGNDGLRLKSVPNKGRVGLLDQYEAWLDRSIYVIRL